MLSSRKNRLYKKYNKNMILRLKIKNLERKLLLNRFKIDYDDDQMLYKTLTLSNT